MNVLAEVRLCANQNDERPWAEPLDLGRPPGRHIAERGRLDDAVAEEEDVALSVAVEAEVCLCVQSSTQSLFRRKLMMKI